MDEIDDIKRRLQFSKLLAKKELLELERTALFREITSPLTSQDRREEVMIRRTDLADECDEITEQLKTLGDPREPTS